MVGEAYIELRAETGKKAALNDLLTGLLADVGFESFVEEGRELLAYIRESEYDADAVQAVFQEFAPEVTFHIQQIAPQNWNATWEAQFEPVEVNEHCLIRAPFHPSMNDGRLEIVIEPRMSFGTGHHATTRLVCKAMYADNWAGLKVLDMGCGTGVLGILAAKLGAESVMGIDIEPWAAENALENAQQNGVHMDCLCGDASLLKEKGHFDRILANINRNILMEDAAMYRSALPQGKIYLSGFLMTDIAQINEAFQLQGFILESQHQEGDWICLVMRTS
jgi:ribosomal protein L11 methyltransferase